jgi:cobyrinic acid a,c-diamide synthase
MPSLPFYRFVIAGAHSGVGKTTVTLGLLAALRARGLRVQPFKCGPDYLDAGHHTRAAGTTSRNLDTWMMGEPGVARSFAHAVQNADAAVVEGVMGLFDGAAADRLEGSTAHVAKLLDLPVVLVVNARSMARSLAALVKGYTEFEPGVRIAGVVANQVGSDTHAALLRRALEASGLPPLLGCLPRTDAVAIPERHLGLQADTETGLDADWNRRVGEWLERHVEVPRLLALTVGERPPPPAEPPPARPVARLGVARDEAFHFYYEDNLDLLRAAGAELAPFSPLHDAVLPPALDGLLLGGGFPEVFAERLAANRSMLESIRAFAAAGGRIVAECGGLMYLCRTLADATGRRHDMCGVLPAETRMEDRCQRLGYVEAVTLAEGPYGPAGTRLRGHEFHWSSMAVLPGSDAEPAFDTRRLRDGGPGCSGLRMNHVWGSYVHAHLASREPAARHWVAWLRAGRPC